MKKLVMLLALMSSPAFAEVVYQHQPYQPYQNDIKYSRMKASNFIEAQMGYLNHGIRGGRSFNLLDVSAGYLNTVNDNSTMSSDVSVHTLDFSVGRNFKLWRLKAGVSGGVGYSIPNPDTGSDKADNGHSWVLGGGVEYPLTYNLSIGLNVKSLFFVTDTRRTTFGSHTETLSTGQDVEVSDTFHSYDSTKLNQVTYALALKYKF